MFKKKLSILFLVVGIFLTGFVFASCVPGQINSTSYCNSLGVWEDLKENGESCINDYECAIQSCYDGICQTQFGSFNETNSQLEDLQNASIILQFWYFINGWECESGAIGCGSDFDYERFEDTDYLICGADNVWETNGPVHGECGYVYGDICYLEGNESCAGEVLSICENSTEGILRWDSKGRINGKCGYTSGGGSGCSPYWQCTAWSACVNGIKTRTCTDINKCGGEVPLATEVSCTVSSYCGDGNCDSSEGLSSCPEDCWKCGDGHCTPGYEDSNTCSADCEPEDKTSWLWLFILIIILLISAIAFVTYLIFKKMHEDDEPKKLDDGKGKPSKPSTPGSSINSNIRKPMTPNKVNGVNTTRSALRNPNQQIRPVKSGNFK